MSVPRFVVVQAAACHLCEDAQEVLAGLARQSLIRVDVVDADGPDGLDLVGRWRPNSFPLVLVDGRFFSQGRLPRGKLRALLEAQGEAAAR